METMYIVYSMYRAFVLQLSFLFFPNLKDEK